MSCKKLKHTNSVDQSPYRETASFSARKNSPVFYETRRFIAMSQCRPRLQTHDCSARLPSCFFKICLQHYSLFHSCVFQASALLRGSLPNICMHFCYKISYCVQSNVRAGDHRVLITIPLSFNSNDRDFFCANNYCSCSANYSDSHTTASSVYWVSHKLCQLGHIYRIFVLVVDLMLLCRTFI